MFSEGIDRDQWHDNWVSTTKFCSIILQYHTNLCYLEGHNKFFKIINHVHVMVLYSSFLRVTNS